MKEKFVQIVSDICFFDPADITSDLSLFEDLAISSIMLVELIATLEKELNIPLDNEVNAIINCQTVGDLYEFIKTKSEQQ